MAIGPAIGHVRACQLDTDAILLPKTHVIRSKLLQLPVRVSNPVLRISMGNRTPISVAIGPAIGQCEHAISSLLLALRTARLTVERSIDLATVGRTMMEASLAWPDSFRRGLATRD